MARQYFLHLGAHRTGSSSFQLCLHENRAALAEQGYQIAFPARDGVRAGLLALRLPAPRHNAEAAATMAEAARLHLTTEIAPEQSARVILSEENIPGGLMHFQKAQFYPASVKRLEALRHALEQPPEAVLFVVRDYGAFYRSCIRKRMEETVEGNFEAAAAAFLAMDRGWLDLLRDIRDVLRPKRLIVVRHEARLERLALLQHLVPELTLAGLMPPSRQLNVSATDTALVELQRIYGGGQKLTRMARRKLIKDLSDSRENLNLTEFTARELRSFSMRYERDLAAIDAEPGLTLL